MDAHMYRNNIKPGSHVKIVLKQDQKSGRLTEGYVDRILTNKQQHPNKKQHPRGIKVMLEDGKVGRVQEIMD